jgi:hypothetical protein
MTAQGVIALGLKALSVLGFGAATAWSTALSALYHQAWFLYVVAFTVLGIGIHEAAYHAWKRLSDERIPNSQKAVERAELIHTQVSAYGRDILLLKKIGLQDTGQPRLNAIASVIDRQAALQIKMIESSEGAPFVLGRHNGEIIKKKVFALIALFMTDVQEMREAMASDDPTVLDAYFQRDFGTLRASVSSLWVEIRLALEDYLPEEASDGE